MTGTRRRIRLLIRKEFLQLRRDPLLLRLLFIMPVMQLVMFGYVVAADVTHLPTAVVDLDRTPVSRQLTSEFAASDYFTVTAHPQSETRLRPLIDSGQAAIAVVVPEGTQAALNRGEQAQVAIVVDGSDSQTASLGSGYATGLVANFNATRLAGSGADAALGSAPGLDARVRVLYNPSLASINTMIPGLVAVILMISIMVIMSQAVVRERESGTLEQMFVTPIRPVEYLVGKVTPYALLAAAQMAVVAAVGLLWFRVPFHGNVLVVLTGLGLFMLTCIGLGLLVSLVSHTRAQAQQAVMFLMLPTMILSGFIFPISSMPAAVQPVTYLIPARFALEVVRGATVKGAGLVDLAPSLLALAGYAVLIFGGAVLATRRRLTE